MKENIKKNRLYIVINVSIVISMICTVALIMIVHYNDIAPYHKFYAATAFGILSIFSVGVVLLISIVHLKVKLDDLEEKIEILAVTDELTSLYNRKYFVQRLVEEFERSRRYNYPISLIIANIDLFKTYNEIHGLLAGDRLLKNIALIIKPLCRISDIVSRYGEEEFAILLPNTGEKGALVVAEKLRSNVEEFRDKKNTRPVTISLGVSAVPPDSECLPETLVYNADAALYRSKVRGSNRVVLYSAEEAVL